jgi:phenylpropionate dioxygenase-like ring-hydroxylating dioxygenase large terminal subunit
MGWSGSEWPPGEWLCGWQAEQHSQLATCRNNGPANALLLPQLRRSVQPPAAPSLSPCRYVRELEVDYVPLMENSCDPGHVHFTHAGFIGSRDKAGPITVRMLEQASQLQAAC